MTNSSPQTPPPSPEEQPNLQQIRQRIRQEANDEWIAIIVAFGTIGAILLWSLGFRKNNVDFTQLNKTFTYSAEIEEGNLDLDERVFTTADNLEITEPTFKIVEKETPSYLFGSVDTIESSKINQRLNNPLVAAPLIGAVEPEVITLEPQLETGLKLDIEPETEAELETEPETEAVIPEPEPEAEPETIVSFSDVPETHWAYPFLQELGKKDLIAATSDNNFEPDDLITRAGMANLISQAFEQPKTIDTKDFKDIDDGNIIAEDIDKAVRTGFMKGYSEDEFRPAENIPRYQVLVALATGLGLEPSGDPVTILQNFSDRDRIPKWAISQVAAATEAGLAVNRPDFDLQSLRPEESATRAEVAAMIYQALQQSGKVDQIDSPYIVPKP